MNVIARGCLPLRPRTHALSATHLPVLFPARSTQKLVRLGLGASTKAPCSRGSAASAGAAYSRQCRRVVPHAGGSDGVPMPAAPSTPDHLPGWTVATRVLGCCAFVAAASLLLPTAAHAAVAAAGAAPASPIAAIIDVLLHLDHHLAGLIATHGTATYAVLWAIVFAETGLVLTPFLPGDSLIFAAGAFAGLGQLSLPILFAVFVSSAVLGDAVNYAVGNKLGTWALERNLLRPEYIAKTEKFYAKHGAKTVVLARFVPIVRTFAPFVAGVGSMPYRTFALYNVGGALLWTVAFLTAGYFVGNVPFVQKNFTAVVLAIVAVSVVPVGVELWQARKEEEEERRQQGSGGSTDAPGGV